MSSNVGNDDTDEETNLSQGDLKSIKILDEETTREPNAFTLSKQTKIA